MKSLIHIVGNRPQFVKLAVLHKELAQSGLFEQQVIHSGQHYDYAMSDLFFEELKIAGTPINLGINNLPHHQFIAKTAEALEAIFARNNHCTAMIYGDTNTTLAAALAARRTNIKLVHFEAGVRTGDMQMPEEINRVLADRLSDINLCCTARNFSTMQAEGYGAGISSGLYLTGDLMFDAFHQFGGGRLPQPAKENYVACTIHRNANINNPDNLRQIIDGLNTINKTIPVIFPVHPNTKKKMDESDCRPQFKLVEPLGYTDMQQLLAACSFVITDSGGVSRESFFLRKQSLVVMEHPFWPEIIDSRCALHCKADSREITDTFFSLAHLNSNFDDPIFGDGRAAEKIKEVLTSGLN